MHIKFRKNMENRMITGVASGLSDLLHIDPTWIRLVFVLLTILIFPFFIIMYFVTAILVPASNDIQIPFKQYHRIREKKMFAGVCTGLAKYFEIDIVLIRLLFIFSLMFNGIGILTYIALWIISPINKQIFKKDIIISKTV